MSSFTSKLIAYSIRFLLRGVLLTCRFNLVGKQHLLSLKKDHSYIIILWHNRLGLIGPSILASGSKRNFTAFASNSKDGKIVGEYTKSYSQGSAIYVPHDKKESALRALISSLKSGNEIAIVTPDGPRGPKYRVKQGVIKAAIEADAGIIPFTWECERYYEVKSWDSFRIPLPFSKLTGYFGAPIFLDKTSSQEDQTKILEEALHSVGTVQK